jgi:uncharacterized protein YdeI (YjbR/CyaY-like superfamily)
VTAEFHKSTPTFYAPSAAIWRDWLAEHHATSNSVFLIIYKKDSGVASVNYSEALDEALCFGWIDSKINKRDQQSFYQYFAKRNPKSNWSKINKQRIEQLERQGKLQPAGIEVIEQAKRTGTWDALNEVDQAVIPDDMLVMMQDYPDSRENFDRFAFSIRRATLEWILNAKTPVTRENRIRTTVEKAAANAKPPIFGNT